MANLSLTEETHIWLCSDWHFGHDREFIWKARGFNSVEEMNTAILTGHNKCVQENEDVYVLGDLMLGDSEKNIKWIKQMNGKLHIVLGNHDTDRRIKMYKELPNVVEVAYAIMLKYKGYHFYLSHYPAYTGNLEKESLKQMTLNLYGHTHQTTNFFEDRPYMYHVGMDSHKCLPVDLNSIIQHIKVKVDECKSFDLEEELPDLIKAPNPYEAYQIREIYKTGYCEKCIHYLINCPGPQLIKPNECPEDYSYKRDPPDGGYYG